MAANVSSSHSPVQSPAPPTTSRQPAIATATELCLKQFPRTTSGAGACNSIHHLVSSCVRTRMGTVGAQFAHRVSRWRNGPAGLGKRESRRRWRAPRRTFSSPSLTVVAIHHRSRRPGGPFDTYERIHIESATVTLTVCSSTLRDILADAAESADHYVLAVRRMPGLGRSTAHPKVCRVVRIRARMMRVMRPIVTNDHRVESTCSHVSANSGGTDVGSSKFAPQHQKSTRSRFTALRDDYCCRPVLQGPLNQLFGVDGLSLRQTRGIRATGGPRITAHTEKNWPSASRKLPA